jgi:hypothetical protein
MQFTLSDEETAILQGLLTDFLPELRREVARTEQREMRRLMVRRQELVERLLDLLGAPPG